MSAGLWIAAGVAVLLLGVSQHAVLKIIGIALVIAIMLAGCAYVAAVMTGPVR